MDENGIQKNGIRDRKQFYHFPTVLPGSRFGLVNSHFWSCLQAGGIEPRSPSNRKPTNSSNRTYKYTSPLFGPTLITTTHEFHRLGGRLHASGDTAEHALAGHPSLTSCGPRPHPGTLPQILIHLVLLWCRSEVVWCPSVPHDWDWVPMWVVRWCLPECLPALVYFLFVFQIDKCLIYSCFYLRAASPRCCP
jgi:hypothetical protein